MVFYYNMLNISPGGNPYRHEVVRIPSDSQKKAVHWPGQHTYFQGCSSYGQRAKCPSFFFIFFILFYFFVIKLLCISFMGGISTPRDPVLFQTLAGYELGIIHTKSEKL